MLACPIDSRAEALTRISDVLALDGRDAKASPKEVRLKGVVLGVSTQFNFFSLHDGTGTIGIMRRQQQSLKQGDMVEVTGMTTATNVNGQWHPRVLLDAIQVTGSGALPEALPVTVKSFSAAENYDQWMSIEGHVLQWEYRAPDLQLRLVTPEGFVETNITVPEAANLPTRLHGAHLRFTGAGVSTPALGRVLFVPDLKQLEVLKPGTQDLFDAPLASFSDIMQRKLAPAKRWRIKGIFAAQTEPRKIVIVGEAGAMQCYLLQERLEDQPGTVYGDAGPWPKWKAGDVVEVVGSIVEGHAPQGLTWCHARVVGSEAPPAPESFNLDTLRKLRNDDRWASLECTVGAWMLADGIMTYAVFDDRANLMVLVRNCPVDVFPRAMHHARLRFTGISTSLAPSAQGTLLLVPNPSFMEVVEAGKEDPFDVEKFSVGDLAEDEALAGRRVKSQGTLIGQQGGTLFIRGKTGGAISAQLQKPWSRPSNTRGMFFADSGPVPELMIGDELEFVGSVIRNAEDKDFAPYDLIGTQVRVIKRHDKTEPPPISATLMDVSQGEHTSDLVEVRGRLVAFEQSPAGTEWRSTLLLEANGLRLPATYQGRQISGFETLKMDDDVVVHGIVSRATPTDPRQLLLASTAEIRSLGISPAVIRQRLWLWGAGGGAVLMVLLIWIAVLRRAGQVQKKAAAELKAAIEAAKASERRWKLLFEQNPLSVQIFDPDGQTKLFNEAWRKLFKLDDAAGYAFNVLKTPRLSAGVVEQIRKAFAGEVTHVQPVPYPMRDDPRDVRWVSGVLYPLKNEEGEIMEVVTIHNDITEIKKAEEAMLAMNQTLEQRVNERTQELRQAQTDLLRALEQERELNELKSRFVTMVSHEFRTPLGIIMSAIELIRHYEERLPPEQRRELCDDIFSATRLMAGLMEQVLVLGRVEAGKLGCRIQPLDVETLAGKLTDESLSATNRRCPVEWKVLNSLDGAEADEALLRHIFSNLIANAVKYSPAGSPVLFTAQREGRNVVFQIIDQGIGIPAEDQSRLFEAFYRCGNVGEIPGTGLGLLIVKRCVELHGGSLQVESKVGKGTTFTVSIPMFDEPGITS